MKLPNKFFPLLAILALFSMTSCSDITSEIWVEKNGGGRMEISVDMASFFPQELMNEFNKEESDSIGMDQVVPKEDPKDAMDELMEMMIKDGEVKDIDTTIALYEMKPGSADAQSEQVQSIYKRIKVHLKGDSEAGTAITKFLMDFKDENEMQETLAGLQAAFMGMGNEGELTDAKKNETIDRFKSNYKRGIIQLPAMKVPDNMGDNMPEEMHGGLDELGGLFGNSDEQSEEDKAQMDFMKNMLGKIVVKVHTPGPVQFTNDPEAEIYGNTVIFKRAILDIGKGPEQGRIVKFEK